MKTILLTGASGFIGRYLLEALMQSVEYKESQIYTPKSKEIETFVFLKHLDKIDVVFHVGAFTPKNHAESADIDGSVANINKTLHLLHNLPEKVGTFIFLSTLDVYEQNNEKITESTKLQPASLYGQAKLFCEKMLEQWAEQHGVTLQILRLGHVYGPGEDAYQKIIPTTCRKILNNNPPTIWGTGTEKRSFLFVSDACRFIINASHLMHYAGPINVCSATAKTILAIVTLILNCSANKLAINFVENKQCVTRDFIFDVSKMHHLLGYEQVAIEDGLRIEYEYFFKQIKGALVQSL